MALNKLTPTTKESGRGGLGGRGQSAPPGGIFKGGNAPLKWSFASFSSNKKRKGLGVLGARPERPLSPGPPRSDRKTVKRQALKHVLCLGKAKSLWFGEAVASRIITSPGQGENFQLGEAESFKLCARPRRANTSRLGEAVIGAQAPPA